MSDVTDPDADRFVRAQALGLATGNSDLADLYGPGFERVTELHTLDINDAWTRVVLALLTTVEHDTGTPAADILSHALTALEAHGE